MGCKKSGSKRKVYSNASLHQETTFSNKKSNKKINKIDKPHVRLIKKKEDTNKIRYWKEVTTDAIEIEGIAREFYKKLYAYKLDNLEEIDKFLKMYNLSRLTQEEIENLNQSITSKEIEMVIKKLPTNISPGPDAFTGEFYQTSNGEIIPSVLKVF